MTRIWLVRHARPATTFVDAVDPGLDEVGHGQAAALVGVLGSGAARQVVTSPLQRAVQTAAPLCRAWRVEALVDPAVGEVPSPAGGPADRLADRLADRGVWLQALLAARWDVVDESLRRWRDALVGRLLGLGADTVVFTHFVAINAAIGAATGDERVVSCHPGHASVTELAIVGGRLEVRSMPEDPPVRRPREP